MADTSAGFRPRYRLCGAPFTKVQLLFQGNETLTKGDIVNLESGEVDLAASGDTALLGVVTETKTGVASTTYIEVIVDEDAVYGVYDANARKMGDALDIYGNTGAMTVASTTTNKDLTVVAPSAAGEETLVKISHGLGAFNTSLEASGSG